jgi:MarR family transcriptional regulator, transcriptional regulator for hemolysin
MSQRKALGMAQPITEAHSLAAEARFEIGFGMADVIRLMRLAFDQRMRVLGLTGTTWRVVAYLSREDGQTQAQLADQLEISRVALGETIDRLERSGHVVRNADPTDRRKWRVLLTPLARDLLPKMFAISDDLRAECFSDLREDDVAQLSSTLHRLRERLLNMKIESPDHEAAR